MRRRDTSTWPGSTAAAFEESMAALPPGDTNAGTLAGTLLQQRQMMRSYACCDPHEIDLLMLSHCSILRCSGHTCAADKFLTMELDCSACHLCSSSRTGKHKRASFVHMAALSISKGTQAAAPKVAATRL